MRGFTERLKRLEVGESMDVEGSTRPNIYMMAKRVGISVSAIGKGRRFRVTKVGYRGIDGAERSTREGSVNDDGKETQIVGSAAEGSLAEARDPEL